MIDLLPTVQSLSVETSNSGEILGGEELSVYCQFGDDTNLTLARQPPSRVLYNSKFVMEITKLVKCDEISPAIPPV